MAVNLWRFLIRAGFNLKIVSKGVAEPFGSIVPSEVKSRIVAADNESEWEFLMAPIGWGLTPGKRTIYSTIWETTALHDKAKSTMKCCDAIVVPCEWNRDVFADNGVATPMHIVPYGIDKLIYGFRPPPPREICVFGAAGRMAHGPQRKGLREVIEAFKRAFPSEKDVTLRIKCFDDCGLENPGDARIQLTRDFLDEPSVARWLSGISCFVSAAKGEGWGLWQHQSLAVGRPCIAPFYGGLKAFLTDDNSYPVKFSEVPASDNYNGCGKWAWPEIDDMALQMRRVYENRFESECKGLQGSIDTSDLTIESFGLETIKILIQYGVINQKRAPTLATFKHSGDWGDIIYSLPTIRALGGGVIYLTESRITRQRMTPEVADKIASLLRHQPYIKDVKFGAPSAPVDYDLDDFRIFWRTKPKFGKSICDWHLECFGMDVNSKDAPWITVDCVTEVPGKPVVVNRTPRYQNPAFPWKKVAEKYRDKACFVGTGDEYERFCKDHKWNLPHVQTKNFLELARVIAGCKLFIGNQSSPYAIAEGLKKKAVLEVWDTDPNCIFDRPNVYHGRDKNVTLPDL